MEENSQNIGKEGDVTSELRLGNIIKNEIGNGETEIVFVNNDKSKQSFQQKIEELSKVITEIQNEEKSTTDTKKIKDKMYKLIETFHNFLKDGDNKSNFVDKKNSYIVQQVISFILTQLNDMSQKLIDDANDCYSKDLLDKLENILHCFDIIIKNEIKLRTRYKNQIFGIMENIMEHKKGLLYAAIKNFQPDKQDEQYKNSSLHSALTNLMETNIKFLFIYNYKSDYYFLTNFYKEVFDKLIPVSNKNNTNDNLEKYKINLINTIFDAILCFNTSDLIYSYAYYIGTLVIRKYYSNNEVNLQVPNLDKFISRYIKLIEKKLAFYKTIK